MQKILLFLSLLVGMQHNAQAQQAWINQTPELNGIAAFDANNAWLVANKERSNDPNGDYYSGLLRTTDGGTSWNFTKMVGFFNLSTPQFFSASEGWIIASDDNENYLRKTTNGGTSWQNMFTNAAAFYFMSATTGWVVENTNLATLSKTTDSGATWTTVSNLPSIVASYSVSLKFTSATNGWFISTNNSYTETYIYATTDGGQTWSLKSTRPITSFYPFSNLEVLSSTDVWVTKKDSMFHTTDGGATWTATKHPNATQTYHVISALKFQTSSIGYTSVYGNLYKTTDGGVTWTSSVQGNNLAIVSASTAWITSFSDLYKTTDSWQTFVKQFDEAGYSKIAPISSTEFYTLTNDNILRKTNFVQGNCNNVGSSTGHFCNNFTVTNNKIWTARTINNESEAIINTSNNGGASFTALDTFPLNGIFRRITEISFINASIGVISDDNNGVYATNDGGSTWAAYTVTGQTSINSLAFVANATDTAIYVVGDGGNIHKSTNKGATWVVQATGLSTSLNKVFFLNPNQGWVVGENGTILRTTNGGTTWMAANTTNAGTVTLRSIHFTSASQGWAVGNQPSNSNNGLILMSNDGGDTWTAQTSTGIDFYQIHMFSATDGYAFGSGIYRYTNLPVAVQEVLTPEQAQNISLYPNPVHDQLTILNEGQANESTFRLLDQTGRQIISGKLNIGANQINVSELPAGMYFIQIQGAQKAYKVIKL